jgi:site-specific recombinase XerD
MFFGYVRDWLYVRLKDQEMRSEHTITAYRQGLDSFRKYLSEKGIRADKATLEMVTPALVREYLTWITDSGHADSTRNHRLTCIKAYLHYCAERDVANMQVE